MAVDIRTIPQEELLSDLKESQGDIRLCETALRLGTTRLRDGSSVQRRLDVNKNIVDQIQAELRRRELVATKEE